MAETEKNNLERTLWDAANKLRGNINSSDYKYVVLGLIFIKYVSDAFETQFAKYKAEGFDETDEDFLRDYLTKDNIFYVPPTARWKYLQDHAKQPQIGELVDKAMDAIEKENKSLKGVLPTNYGREELDKTRLGELIDLFTNKIRFLPAAQGTAQAGGTDSKPACACAEGKQAGRDLLGRVYEYFMGMFADSEGKHGGEFYTPRSIVRLLVAMIQPFKGRVYDPCCGSGGMFVSSEDFVAEHSGRIGDLSATPAQEVEAAVRRAQAGIAIYGQELNTTTWRLAKMNMAIRGIDADIRQGDTLNVENFFRTNFVSSEKVIIFVP
jgi:type I restriction enzyme M protein